MRAFGLRSADQGVAQDKDIWRTCDAGDPGHFPEVSERSAEGNTDKHRVYHTFWIVLTPF